MVNRIKELTDRNIQIGTRNAEIVGTFYGNLSSNIGILAFPGFTEHRSSLDELCKMLSKEFKVWAFDINSQGDSTGNWDLREIIESVYEIQRCLKDHYGLRKIGAYGNSIGGMAAGLNANEGSNIESICLTSTPAALQDIVPWYNRLLLKSIPQSLVRYGTIQYDKTESLKNENYRNKSHVQFLTKEEYRPYAQFGAMKIPSLKNVMKWIGKAPRLDKYAGEITKPALLIYGGEDHMLGIKDSKLPKKIQRMYYSIASKEKMLVIFKGADHSLNSKTQTDDCFNKGPEYGLVKKFIMDHFGHYFL